MMAQPGAIGYVLINFDGIPVKHYPEDFPQAVQYAALIADLVQKTKNYLKNHPSLNQQQDSEFVYLRMRTKEETELIVTNYIAGANEYILVTIQSCKFGPGEVEENTEAKK